MSRILHMTADHYLTQLAELEEQRRTLEWEMENVARQILAERSLVHTGRCTLYCDSFGRELVVGPVPGRITLDAPYLVRDGEKVPLPKLIFWPDNPAVRIGRGLHPASPASILTRPQYEGLTPITPAEPLERSPS